MLKGKLISIGGNEYKHQEEDEEQLKQDSNEDFFELSILERFVAECGGIDSKIEVVTSASRIPFQVGESYTHAFEQIGCTNVSFMHVQNREEAQNPELLERLQQAKGILFSGGDQSRLWAFFGDTDFLTLLRHRYDTEGFIIAGTSAGAMIMSDTMIAGGNSKKSLLKGEVDFGQGFGLMPRVIVDSHFVTRGRFGRLAQAVATHPNLLGIGLGEDTSILVTDSDEIEVIGSGLVLIFDGQNMTYNNIAKLKEGVPVSLANMIFHALSKGDHFNLKTKKFVVAPLEPNLQA